VAAEIDPYPVVEINTKTAADLGIEDGEWVTIENRRGRIKRKAVVTPTLHPKVVMVPHGWWYPETEGREPNLFGIWEINCNQLIPTGTQGRSGFWRRCIQNYPLQSSKKWKEGGREMARNGLLIDYEYCTGCHTCEVACKQEHNYPVGKWGIKVNEIVLETFEKIAIDYIPFPTDLCNLCVQRTKRRDSSCVREALPGGCMTFGPVTELAKVMEKKPKTVLFAPK